MAKNNPSILQKATQSIPHLAKYTTRAIPDKQEKKTTLNTQKLEIDKLTVEAQQEEKKKMKDTGLEKDCDLNCWITPGYDSLPMLASLIQDVNGSGGPIDQSHLYIELKSALDWLNISNNEDYITASNDMPLDDVVNAIQYQLKQFPHLEQSCLDIIALGPGNGYTEVKLIKKLLKQTSIHRIRVYLLDISQPLVNYAYNYAKGVFSEEPNVSIIPAPGNFSKLYQYKRLLSISKNANHLPLVTMFGYTFGNLENERRFFLDSLNAFPKNTLFLFDLGLTFAPSENREEIMKMDPWLSGRSRWREATERFLEGPIRRYRNGLRIEDKVQFRANLDYSRCPILKSYCVELIATLPDKTEFPMRYFKRYDQVALARCMREDGWDSLDAWYYSENKGLLQLARRQ